jgi:hypothetical protein
MLGGNDLVGRILGTKGESQWHLKGWRRVSEELKLWMAVSGMSSWVVDAFLSEILDDDRLAVRLEGLSAILIEEFEWICGLSPFVCEEIGRAAAAHSGSSFLHEIVLASMIVLAYTNEHALEPYKDYPYKLGHGPGLDVNLTRLADPTVLCPTREQVTCQIRTLLTTLRYSKSKIVEGFNLLMNSSTTVKGTEEQHVACAVVSKQRAGLAANMLTARGFMVGSHHLVAPVKESNRIKSMRSELRRLESARLCVVLGRTCSSAMRVRPCSETSLPGPTRRRIATR